MYESPITLIENQVSMDIEKAIEGEIWKATKEIGVVVDKDELIKALEYDRDQYYKGYQDAKDRYLKTGHWIEEPNCWTRCSRCGEHYPQTSIYGFIGSNYCPNCGAKMEEQE